MPHLALVTSARARALDEDLAPLASALRACAAEVSVVDWDDRTVDWAAFDLALLRSPWDYAERVNEFLAWATRAASTTCLLNPLALLRWTIDKHYLADLAANGVATVPSRFLEPHEDPERGLDAFLDEHADAAEFVIKPAIGAGSRDAQRHARSAHNAALAHVRRLLDAGRAALLQPYLDRVDDVGETALVFVDGAFSHAIRKGALLKRNEASTEALFAPEQITPRVPDAAELALARRAVAAVPCERAPLYARVDLIRDDAGAPRVLELELAEPSLFFDHAAGSAERFARAVLARFDTRVVTK